MAKSLLGQSNSQLMLSSKMERNENLSVVFDSISGEMLLEDVLVVFFFSDSCEAIYLHFVLLLWFTFS